MIQEKINEFNQWAKKNKAFSLASELTVDYIEQKLREQPKLGWIDIIWQHYLNISVSEKCMCDSSSMAGVKRAMAEFLMFENKWELALHHWCGFVYSRTSGVSLLNKYYENKKFWMDWRWHRDGVGKWVTYNERMQKNGIMKKGLFAIYPIEAKKIAECQENAKITDDDFKFIFFNAVAENELPIHLFTVDECLNIYFWERDEKFDLVAELYELAKSRLPMRNY